MTLSSGGIEVTLTGSGFLDESEVLIGGKTCKKRGDTKFNMILCILPEGVSI